MFPQVLASLAEIFPGAWRAAGARFEGRLLACSRPSSSCFFLAPASSPSDVDAAAELTPALLVLNKLVLASEESRMAVKRAIFPPEADKVRVCTCTSMTNPCLYFRLYA